MSYKNKDSLKKNVKNTKFSALGYFNFSENEFVFEYKDKGKKKFYIEKNHNSYFSDFSCEKLYGDFFRIMIRKAMELRLKEKGDKILFDFKLNNGSISYDNFRKGSIKGIDQLKVKFENEENYNFHFTDFKDAIFNRFIRDLELKTNIKSEKLSDGLFIKYIYFKKLEEELIEKSADRLFLSKFYSLYLKFLHKESGEVKTEKFKSVKEYILKLKRLNLELAILNYFYTRILNNAIEIYMKENKIESTGELKFSDDEILKKLFLLKNNVKKYIEPIMEKYRIKIMNKSKIKDRLLIDKICKISLKDQNSFIKKDRSLSLNKDSEGKTKIKAEFPLKGMVLSPGNAEGYIRIISQERDIAKVKKNEIVVSDYFDSKLSAAILKAKAVIMSRGGFLSHAAILSRELKKPCIGALPGCMNILEDGQKIKILKGSIYKL